VDLFFLCSSRKTGYLTGETKGKENLQMTQTLTLTSKRQATFPVRFCEEMNVRPGDKIVLERKELEDGPAWVLHPAEPARDEWFGILKHRAANKPHDMESIRESIHRKKAVS
jgi:bifunctional DNA-binding transcriptional regulator/antitoxin component of YhaV-PrlF toxin-antitoxin module